MEKIPINIIKLSRIEGRDSVTIARSRNLHIKLISLSDKQKLTVSSTGIFSLFMLEGQMSVAQHSLRWGDTLTLSAEGKVNLMAISAVRCLVISAQCIQVNSAEIATSQVLHYHPFGQSFERVTLRKMMVQQLLNHDGVDGMFYEVEHGKPWGIVPTEIGACEVIIALEGDISLQHNGQQFHVQQGDGVVMDNIQSIVEFHPKTDCTALYISSSPSFYIFSQGRKQLMELAVQVEEKDGHTSDHCQRIREMAINVGKRLHMSAYELTILADAAYLHDVGKLKIPLEILCKPSRLTEEEYEVIKQHPVYGRELLLPIPLPYMQEVAEIVAQHHERYDGKGYPFHLKANEIRREARIIAIVDSYDAMTHDRVYSKARTKDEALEELRRCAGSMYDPELVEVFVSFITASKKY